MSSSRPEHSSGLYATTSTLTDELFKSSICVAYAVAEVSLVRYEVSNDETKIQNRDRDPREPLDVRGDLLVGPLEVQQKPFPGSQHVSRRTRSLEVSGIVLLVGARMAIHIIGQDELYEANVNEDNRHGVPNIHGD